MGGMVRDAPWRILGGICVMIMMLDDDDDDDDVFQFEIRHVICQHNI